MITYVAINMVPPVYILIIYTITLETCNLITTKTIYKNRRNTNKITTITPGIFNNKTPALN